MIEKLKKLFTKDKSIEIQLIEVIKRQQEFIDRNINERVVYVDPQSGYTNVERFDDPNAGKTTKAEEEEDLSEPEDMTAEDLRIHMENIQQQANSEEGEK
ncbi:MAG: hypothetical protein RBT65_15105 [Methanolobus sp.]|jgi:hypothetical protein|nr:hypothetical protein [Methanolobus sp.]